jgi:hypothetical protein
MARDRINTEGDEKLMAEDRWDEYAAETAPAPTGWLYRPKEVKASLARMPVSARMFRDAAPDLMGDGLDKNIFLYKAWKDVLGQYPAYPAQVGNDCTSQGGGHGVDLTACIEIAIGHEAEEFKDTCTEFVYAAGLMKAGMKGDNGCYGSAIAEALTDVGTVSREAVGGPYSAQRLREWARAGRPPEEFIKLASEHKIGARTLCKTWEELCAGMASGHVTTVASSQGFSMTRDANGICRAEGRWDHQMLIVAVINVDLPGAPFAVIAQSWGANVPSGPTPQEMPNFCFGAPKIAVQRMLAVGDSWTIAQLNGYPRRDLPSDWSYEMMA